MANEVVPVAEFITAHKTLILERFPKLNAWLTPEVWFSITLDLAKRPELQDVVRSNPDSLLKALLDLASWGLKPDGEEAFINVRTIDQRKTALAQWMYKGGIRRAKETGAILHAVADVIREGDEYEEAVDRHGRQLKHKRDISKKGRRIIAAYCLFWLPGGLMDYELLDVEDIEFSKGASARNMNGKTSPAWEHRYSEMAKKCAYRRGLKRMQGKTDSGFESMMNQPGFDVDVTPEASGELTEEETPRARQIEVVVDEEGGASPSETGADRGEGPGSPAGGDALSADEKTMARELLAKAPGPLTAKLMKIRQNGLPGFAGVDNLKASELEAFAKALQ